MAIYSYNGNERNNLIACNYGERRCCSILGGEPLYKVEKMHTIGAFTALICGTLWVATFHPFIVSFAWLFWGAYVLLKLPKPYYLGEVIALALIYLTITI